MHLKTIHYTLFAVIMGPLIWVSQHYQWGPTGTFACVIVGVVLAGVIAMLAKTASRGMRRALGSNRQAAAEFLFAPAPARTAELRQAHLHALQHSQSRTHHAPALPTTTVHPLLPDPGRRPPASLPAPVPYGSQQNPMAYYHQASTRAALPQPLASLATTAAAFPTPARSARQGHRGQLLLGPEAVMPLETSLTSALVIDGQPRRPAAPIFLEEWAKLGLPMLVIDVFGSYTPLLSALAPSVGYLSGSGQEEVQEHLDDELHARYFPIDQSKEAISAGKALIREGLQLIFNMASYADANAAGQMLLGLLAGLTVTQQQLMAGTQTGGQPRPCIILLTDTLPLLPANDDDCLLTNAGVAQQLFDHFCRLMEAAREETPAAIAFYAVASSIDGLSDDVFDLSRLGIFTTTNEQEVTSIGHLLNLEEEAEDALGDGETLLVDGQDEQGTLTFVRLRKSKRSFTLPSRPSRRSMPLPVTVPVVPLPDVEGDDLGKARAEDDREDEGDNGEGSSSAHTTRPFTAQQMAYAVLLKQTGCLSKNALRRPPTTKMAGEWAISCADLASELGLKAAYSDRDVMGGERAGLLLAMIEGLSEVACAPYLAQAEAALAAITARREEDATRTGFSAIGAPPSRWALPALDLLIIPQEGKADVSREVAAKGRALQEMFDGFGVAAHVMQEYTSIGPRVVRFGVLPTEAGGRRTKVEHIVRLKKDMQRTLQAQSLRLLDPVPGTPYIGVEIPNANPSMVRIREILESREFQRARMQSRLLIALGRDVENRVRFFDLARAPHVLIAGTTGAGKSVAINTLIVSLLIQATPEDVRMVMVDPKKVELGFYNGIPHLLGPVITDMNAVAPMLKYAIREMQRRYDLFSALEVRNISEYREERMARLRQSDASLETLPAYVILIDELANAMYADKDTIEPLLCDLIALGRAAGIHLILATQRPVVDVVTGNIKAQLPTRIGFMVPQANDSRVILDQVGAETLLGKGDMLFLNEEIIVAERIQCALTDTVEAKRVAAYWKQLPHDRAVVAPIAQGHLAQLTFQQEWIEPAAENGHEEREQEAEIDEELGTQEDDLAPLIAAFLNGETLPIALDKLPNEKLYRFAEAWVRRKEEVAIQDLMILLGVGQPRAKRLMTWLEERGVVSADRGAGRKRQVLIQEEDSLASPL